MDRVRTSIWSNIDSIAQRIEASTGNVSTLLEQMSSEIKKAKQELLRVLAEEKRLRKQAVEREKQAQQWLSRAELAVRNGNDDLARDALIQRKRIAEEIQRDSSAANEHQLLASEMSKDIRLMEAKRNDIAARKSTIGAALERQRGGGGVESLGSGGKTNAFDELAHVEQAIEEAELENEARDEVDRLMSPVGDVPFGDEHDPNTSPPRRKLRIE